MRKPRTIIPNDPALTYRCKERLDKGETFTLDEYLKPSVSHDEFWEAINSASR